MDEMPRPGLVLASCQPHPSKINFVGITGFHKSHPDASSAAERLHYNHGLSRSRLAQIHIHLRERVVIQASVRLSSSD